MTRRFWGGLSLGIAATAVFVACTSKPLAAQKWTARKWTEGVGERLDRVAQGIEEFGTISVSSPLLARANLESFAFNLAEQGPKEYYAHAQNPQAKAASSRQSASAIGAGLDIQADLVQLRKYLFESGQAMSDEELFETRRKLQIRAVLLEAEAIRAKAANGTPEEKAQAEADAAKVLAEKLPAVERPDAPTSAGPQFAADRGIPSATTLRDLLKDEKFDDFLDLIGGTDDIRLSDQSAISIAAANTTTEAIFNLLGSPEQAIKFKDKRLLFAVCSLSVRPGWRTRQGYAGDVSVSISYGWHPARPAWVKGWNEANENDVVVKPAVPLKIGNAQHASQSQNTLQASVIPASFEPQDGKGKSADIKGGSAGRGDPQAPAAPLVAAVSPMIDADVQDLQSSVRKQRAMALRIAAALSLAGAQGQGGIFSEFAERLERDIATRSTDVVANSYSVSGGICGFQVGPRLRGLVDPASPDAAPGESLERQTFPVLLIIGIDESDFRPRLMPATVQDAEGKQLEVLDLCEPHLEFRQSFRWLPLSYSEKRLSEDMLMNWAKDLHGVDQLMIASKCDPSCEDECCKVDPELQSLADGVAGHLKHRSDILWYQAIGSFSYQDIPIELLPVKTPPAEPPAPAPQITQIAPNTITWNEKDSVEVVLLVDELASFDLKSVKMLPEQTDVKAEKFGDADNAIRLTFTPKAAGAMQASFPCKTADGRTRLLFSPIITIRKAAATAQGENPAPAAKAREFTTTQTTSSKDGVQTVKESTSIPPDTPGDISKAYLERNKPVPAPEPKK